MLDEREWLETNVLGGFASSTVAGLNTRRYHGLLVAATKPPVGRMVLLSKLEETLVVNGRRYDLSANRYPGVIHPLGYQYLKQFRHDPFPSFLYGVEGLELEKSVFMVHGENTTVIRYELRGPMPESCLLELRPLIAFRNYHSTTHENGELDPGLEADTESVKVAPYPGLPPLYLSHTGARVERSGYWYRNFEYDAERERGLDFREDLFNPCVLTFEMRGARADIVASTERRPADSVGALQAAEITRRNSVMAMAPARGPLVRMLARAADQFIVTRGQESTVIAGYHWFTDWGRDTMIALPGLTLATGRYSLAKSILVAFSGAVNRGMLPNRFPDAGESPEYNTVDATLWFFEAVRALLAYTADYGFVQEYLYGVLADIVAWHERGTRYGIHMDSDALLYAGEPGTQLTWMDAKIGDWVVTPRRGKPVEIQALWYNALCIMEHLAQTLGDESAMERYRSMAAVASWSFNRLFWNENAGCLFDVTNGGPPDAAIRPNQIFAVSLAYSMLSPERAKRVVENVQEHLLTPFGLRSLSSDDAQYQGRYTGGPRERDGAYHQGTVWPWLMGPFITAYLKVNQNSDTARRQAAAWLEPLKSHLQEAGLGQIPEIFEGDPPHRPCGCIAQAWSVAEVLRAYVEDVREFRSLAAHFPIQAKATAKAGQAEADEPEKATV